MQVRMAAIVDHGIYRTGDRAFCAGSERLKTVPPIAGVTFTTDTPVVSIELFMEQSPCLLNDGIEDQDGERCTSTSA